MKKYIKNILPAGAFLLAVGMTSCTKDLDVDPISPKISTEYSAEGLFNKCYANFAMAGLGDGGSGDGDCDVAGYNDPGMTNLIRLLWNLNELTTDEAICTWGDAGIPELNFDTFDGQAAMAKALFARLTLGVTSCNQYLAVASDHDATMTAEIRYLRALQYYLLMDLYGNIPFSETIEKPGQYTRAQVYEWLENELTAIEPQLSEAKAKKSTDAGYGRVDKAAAWMLLARLYLNAEVYTGTAQWDKAIEYAQKVMNSSYKLNENGAGGWSAYQMLFMADNGETNAAYEGIFPIYQDGKVSTSYGNTTFLVGSTFTSDMVVDPVNDPTGTNGTIQNWAGNRARVDLYKKFFSDGKARELASYDMIKEAKDDRALFWGIDRTLDIDSYTAFKEGYSVTKFTGYKTDGAPNADATFTDGDWFFFRVAEAYLTYAEALTRKAGSNNVTGDALEAVNKIRTRANASPKTEMTLDQLLDEWSREFYFEGRRRVDLVRYGKFGGNNGYNWQWKGGVKNGRDFEAYKNVFAIPDAELNSNTNLTQNPGY